MMTINFISYSLAFSANAVFQMVCVDYLELKIYKLQIKFLTTLINQTNNQNLQI